MPYASIGPIAIHLPERVETNDDLRREHPEWNLDQIEEKTGIVHDDLEEYLRRLDEALLPEPIVYRNQTGKEFSTARGDVLTHLLMHGGYHRGQIARALRQAGHEPVNTDYITWVRDTTA